MHLLVIPTYNRSAKLRRVLDWYRSERLRARIVLLDASSDAAHREANARITKDCEGFVTRIETPGQDNIVKRMLTFLETIDDEIVAIGNDEDAFLPEFLDTAFDHLHTNPDYVLATGRYITSARPLLGLRRISYWTDTFLGLDVDDADPAVRVINFQRLNAGGVPPLYWSVRRKSAFVTSCRGALRLRMSSAHELMDQITACALGKIRISARPMLLRDESKLHNVGPQDRDAGALYIGAIDLAEMEKISAEAWGSEVAVAVRAVTSWYQRRESGESYGSRLQSRSYCRFSSPRESGHGAHLGLLHGMIRWSCTIGIVLSQFFAYLYFVRYMFRSGRGRGFLKMTRMIPVQKID